MLGAIIGDVVGSRFEWHNHRSKNFELLNSSCFFTDDSVMTVAIANALMERTAKGNVEARAIQSMQKLGRKYPNAGYGHGFCQWIFSDTPRPYNSYGNGAAMRVSAVGFFAKNEKEALSLAESVTAVTHNHPEGIKGAQATTLAIFLARNGATKEEIRKRICDEYYDIDFTLDEIRLNYRFNETCQNTVPQALEAFFESTDFEDAIRNAISIGGDSDTLAAITGSIAEAYYGIDTELKKEIRNYLPDDLLSIVDRFDDYSSKTI